MDLLSNALRAGQAAPAAAPARPAARRALVVGAGGPLGAAVLEQALGRGGFEQVLALTVGPLAPALRGFRALPQAWLSRPALPPIDTAFIVFDRERHANGREAVFHRPEPAELLPLASALHAAGVRRLLLVLPQPSGLMPQALRLGLASLDEAAVAALGFEQLLILRPAAAPGRGTAAGLLPRLAAWLLGQLHWMVPVRQQPVRPQTTAAFAVALARALPAAPGGSRVVAPELVWLAAQTRDVDGLAARWLAGEALPETETPRQRW